MKPNFSSQLFTVVDTFYKKDICVNGTVDIEYFTENDIKKGYQVVISNDFLFQIVKLNNNVFEFIPAEDNPNITAEQMLYILSPKHRTKPVYNKAYYSKLQVPDSWKHGTSNGWWGFSDGYHGFTKKVYNPAVRISDDIYTVSEHKYINILVTEEDISNGTYLYMLEKHITRIQQK